MRHLLIAAALCLSLSAFADDDEVTEQDVQQMRMQLDDPQARQALIDQDPKSRAMHDQVSSFAGSEENTNEVYRIASKVLEKIAQDAGGDPEKMMMLLTEAQKNPEAFARNLTPDQQAAIRQLAAQIEQSKR